jgi:hypothetical protein
VHGCTARSVGARTRTFHIDRSPGVATSSGYWPPPREADTAFRKRNADRAPVSDTARRRRARGRTRSRTRPTRVAESTRSSRVRELETAASRFGLPAMTSSRTGGVALTCRALRSFPRGRDGGRWRAGAAGLVWGPAFIMHEFTCPSADSQHTEGGPATAAGTRPER